MANVVVWFDVPCLDLDRALKFYSAVLGKTMKREEFPGMSIGVFPHEGTDVGGCLFTFTRSDERPSAQGLLVYLSAQGRLDEAIAAVEPNGGKVVQPKHQIGPHGYLAVILDSDGNRIALHSP